MTSDSAQFLVAPGKAALPAPDIEGYKLAAVHGAVTAADVQNSGMSSLEEVGVLGSDSGAAERAYSAQGGARQGLEYGVRDDRQGGKKKKKAKKSISCASCHYSDSICLAGGFRATSALLVAHSASALRHVVSGILMSAQGRGASSAAGQGKGRGRAAG